MKVVSCLKDTELQTSEIVTVEGINIIVRILGTEDKKIYLGEIPSIYRDKTIFYTQIGSCIYIGTEDITNSITFIYVIEQEIKNNRLSIKNIYSDILVGEGNILARFFKYDKEFQQENLRIRLMNVIDEIPVIIEKDYLKEKIEEYINTAEIGEIVEATFEKGLEKKGNFIKKINEQISTSNQKEIKYNGRVFRSISEFCRENNIKESMFYYYRNKGYSLDEMVKKNQKTDRGKTRKARKISSNVEIEYNGVTYRSMQSLSDSLNIPQATFARKFKMGLPIEQIIEEDKNNKEQSRKHYDYGKKFYNYLGQEMTLKELADLSGILPQTIKTRIDTGWTIEKAVETPVYRKD